MRDRATFGYTHPRIERPSARTLTHDGPRARRPPSRALTLSVTSAQECSRGPRAARSRSRLPATLLPIAEAAAAPPAPMILWPTVGVFATRAGLSIILRNAC